MKVTAIKTAVVRAGDSLDDLLNAYLTDAQEKSVVVVTSKIIALSENRVAAAGGTTEAKLIREEADYVLPENMLGKYVPLTIKDNTLIPAAGIDKSNSSGDYVLWPRDSQKSANDIRTYLKRRFGLDKIGVIITDSSAMPLRFGTIGIPIAYSGFNPFKDYTGEKDLFGFPLKAGRANIAGALAAAAVAVMGEGTEQTPLALISELPFVEFSDSDPTPEELESYFVPPDRDKLFEPFFKSVPWQKGGSAQDAKGDGQADND